MEQFARYRVLIDEAAAEPKLGFPDYADALSDIIRGSTPEFAVGIFGSWGTGKTTLMREIERELEDDPTVVTAWFTAWRYEREPHLIVPLIDVLREALDAQAATEPGPGPARAAAGKLRRAGRAFIAGLTLSAKVPGVELQLDPGKVMAELRGGDDSGSQALSFYHAAFLLLREAIQEYSDGGARRVVIFVDDLDRCLPVNALDVLESMKLFFDVQGCVFVVGLDQAVAERAVAEKYVIRDATLAEHSPVSGVEYLKKIFQVPFALPSIRTTQIQEYCEAMLRSSKVDDEQLQDYYGNVAPHLDFLPDEDAVNPRELKRLVNAYVLQIKMLSRRLGPVVVNPRIVLALQVMSFRVDWRDYYEELAADPQVFQQTLRDAVAGDTDQLWLAGRAFSLSAELRRYLTGPASDVLHSPDLPSYVWMAESTRSTDPMLLEAQAALNRLRAAIEHPDRGEGVTDVLPQLGAELSRLTDVFRRRTDVPRLTKLAMDLENAGRHGKIAPSADGGDDVDKLRDLLSTVETELRELRRTSNLGAYS